MNSKNDHVELQITNFGPIASASINLRPLTVFVGPSNTGKSYLAVLIYALHQFFVQRSHPLRNPYFRRKFLSSSYGRKEQFPEEAVQFIAELFENLVDEGNSSVRNNILLPNSIVGILRSGLVGSKDRIIGEINRCFGISDVRYLTRNGSSSAARITVRQHIANAPDVLEHIIPLGRNSKLKMDIPENQPIPIDIKNDQSLWVLRHIYAPRFHDLASDIKSIPHMHSATAEALDLIGNMILPSIIGPLHLPAHYLPADRTGIMHAHNVVVSALISSASSGGLRPVEQMPMLSGVLADFLEQLIEIATSQKKPSQSTDLSEDIEKKILAGSVHVQTESHTNYPRFVYKPKGWPHDLSLANSSSMVSELAPVVLYLRHIVRSDNILIVEEPESHLHPAMQVEFTRQLSALVNAGIRVIVTTHSEWLLEELSNIVRRSKLPKSNYGDETRNNVALRSDQVGVWLFEQKQRPKGSAVKEIYLDDSGLYPSGYEEIATTLHNDWAELSSQIGSSK